MDANAIVAFDGGVMRCVDAWEELIDHEGSVHGTYLCAGANAIVSVSLHGPNFSQQVGSDCPLSQWRLKVLGGRA